MQKQDLEESGIIKIFIYIVDITLLCLSMVIVYYALDSFSPVRVAGISLWSNVAIATLCYLPPSLLIPPILLGRVVRSDRIIQRVFQLTLLQFILFSAVHFATKEATSRSFIFYFFMLFTIALTVERLSLRSLVKRARKNGRNQRDIIFVGRTEEFKELASRYLNRSYGYRIIGFFSNNEEDSILDIPCLGKVADVIPFLKENKHVTDLYCAIAGINKTDIFDMYSYCENNVVRFYALPAYLSFLRRNMIMSHVGSTMLLSSRKEPLQDMGNSMLKRLFDITVSGIFLITLFPIVYVIVAIIIKRSSPGPVFFKQKRNGLNGKVFNCFKFRSMHVNKDADKIQATENDPRKFKFGDLMRRTNIDELPQFINVFRGDMSLVGPRPHMLLHTEEYSQLINKYMVRHWVKPGITGWAQVQGFRGETKELSQMEARVHADIWYVENWTFWLDIRIMWLTVWNMIRHNEEHAY